MPKTVTPPPHESDRPFDSARANPDGTVTLYYAGENPPPMPPAGPSVPESVPKRLARLVLLGSGKLGPSVTTLAQLDAAILGRIDDLIPAGLQREAAKAAWSDSSVFEFRNPTLRAMMVALGITEPELIAMFQQAEAMRQAELSAGGSGA